MANPLPPEAAADQAQSAAAAAKAAAEIARQNADYAQSIAELPLVSTLPRRQGLRGSWRISWREGCRRSWSLAEMQPVPPATTAGTITPRIAGNAESKLSLQTNHGVNDVKKPLRLEPKRGTGELRGCFSYLAAINAFLNPIFRNF